MTSPMAPGRWVRRCNRLVEHTQLYVRAIEKTFVGDGARISDVDEPTLDHIQDSANEGETAAGFSSWAVETWHIDHSTRT